MSDIYPFRALHPRPEFVEDVACPPYDVISTSEARSLAAANPKSFVRVVRPEAELPPDLDPHSEHVYSKGADNLKAHATSDMFSRDTSANVYVYRTIRKGKTQTGVFACVSTDDYKNSRILKHEQTRPVKEEDRTRHILAQQAHAEPVMLTYRDNATIDELVVTVQERTPLFDIITPAGNRHTIWRETSPRAIVDAFGEVGMLYVADGHHRCAAATNAADRIRAGGAAPGSSEFARFPAVLIPMSQMLILAYNRVVFRLPMTTDAFLEMLKNRSTISKTDKTSPDRPGNVCLYLDGNWYEAILPETSSDNLADTLDVARLSEHLLDPILGISDVTTDANIEFAGGARGYEFLEEVVDSGQAELAISMYPTQIEDLVAISDAGLLMPPKSTWFEPKLISGLLIHEF